VVSEPTAEVGRQNLNVYKKKLIKKPGTKSSVGSSSVPAPSAKDHSATKPASAPAKCKVQPIPFNQYGSNLEEDFSQIPVLQPEAISMTIILDEDSLPTSSDAPIDPTVLKRSKLSAADRADIGWESPEDWEYDNETLAAKIAKLKKKKDGEVDNPPSSPCKTNLAGEVAAAAQVAKAKRSAAVVSPISGSRTSARGKGLESEPILQKAIKRAAAKAGTGTSSPIKSKFTAFSSTPDLFFLGLAEDCGLSLGDAASSPTAVLSVIRARELAQAKFAEAAERQAQLEAAKTKESSLEPQPSTLQGNTSVVPPDQVPPRAGCQEENYGDPETIIVASLAKKKKRKTSTTALPPRTNLRSTPARQARAALEMSQ
jgi:hypothetical protein